jgi:nitrite reductase/ring-hydroxylating ferredoxin subunit
MVRDPAGIRVGAGATPRNWKFGGGKAMVPRPDGTDGPIAARLMTHADAAPAGPPTDDLPYHDVGPVDRFRAGRPQPALAGGREILVVRLGERDVAACKAVCPHAGAPLTSGVVDTTARTLRCRDHGHAFDLHSGERVAPEPAAGESPVPLRIFPARVTADGRVEVAARRRRADV